MLDALRNLLRGRPILIQGVGKLKEGQSKKVDVGDIMSGGKQVVLCRVDGSLHAVDALCPHEGGRISDGPLHDGKHLMCPLHNYQFDPTNGRCVNMECKSATVYRVREKNGDCELWM